MKLLGRYPFSVAARPNGRRAEKEAAEWLACREFGFSADDHANFDRWLLSDPRNVEAVKRIEFSWQFMRRPYFTGQAAALAEEIERRVQTRVVSGRHRKIVYSFVGLAAVAFSVIIAIRHLAPQRPEQVSNNGLVKLQPEIRNLPDGSVIDLNTGAEITVNFTPQQRDVRLVRGEAHFRVTKNAARPFVVTAGNVLVRAVGTEFDVRLASRLIDVLVTEGKVSVKQMASDASNPNAEPSVKSVFLVAGNKLTVAEGKDPSLPSHVQSLLAANIASELAWRNKRVEFTNTPLGDVVDMLNRENHQQLGLADPSLAEIHVSGICFADDPESFSRLIEASAGLRALHEADGRIVLERR